MSDLWTLKAIFLKFRWKNWIRRESLGKLSKNREEIEKIKWKPERKENWEQKVFEKK